MLKPALLVSVGLASLTLGCGGGGASTGVDASQGSDSGSSSSVGSCDLRSSAGYCQEYAFAATALAAYHTSCTTNGGTWADAACPRASALGGCGRTEAGFGETANWFYAGGPYADANAVMTVCAGDPAAHFIAP